MTALGVDVGGTSVRVCSERGSVSTAAVPGGYDDLLETVTRMAPRGLLNAVVVGLPGATSPAAPRWVPALPWLDGRPLAADLGARLGGAPVTLANDAQLALLAEVREGVAQGARDAVLVSVGTGVGGAIMSGGRIIRGAHGTAGAFGWLPAAGIEATADHGALELAAAGTALDRLAGSNLTGRDLIAAACSGDSAARAAVDGWAGALGNGIAALASILDPDLVIIAGGLCEAFDAYAEPLRAAVRRAGSPDARAVAVVPAGLGAHAGALGALFAADSEVGVWS